MQLSLYQIAINCVYIVRGRPPVKFTAFVVILREINSMLCSVLSVIYRKLKKIISSTLFQSENSDYVQGQSASGSVDMQ